MINELFITGTDTDAGKTLITGLLFRGMQELGIHAITQKWVQCGNTEHTDIDSHDDMSVNKPDPSLMPLRLPYLFKDPVSPHLANTGEPINPKKLEDARQKLQEHHELTLIEGAGGLRVPLSPELNTTDLLCDWKLPCILVVANKVGCINHSLLSIEALRHRDIPLLGIIITNPTDTTHSKAAADNPGIISKIGNTPILGTVPYDPELLTGQSPHLSSLSKTLAQGVLNELD